MSTDLPYRLRKVREALKTYPNDPAAMVEQDMLLRPERNAVYDLLANMHTELVHMRSYKDHKVLPMVEDQRDALLFEIFSGAVLLHGRADNVFGKRLIFVHCSGPFTCLQQFYSLPLRRDAA
jgi:hypothetical protein